MACHKKTDSNDAAGHEGADVDGDQSLIMTPVPEGNS